MKKIIWITTPDGNAYIDAEEILAVVETYKPFKSPPSTTTGESEVRAVRSHVFLKGAESYFVAIEEGLEMIGASFFLLAGLMEAKTV